MPKEKSKSLRIFVKHVLPIFAAILISLFVYIVTKA